MSKVFVFDGDDTLWMNEWQYSQAFTEFFAYLYSQFKDCMPNFIAVEQRFNEIDKELFAEWGIRRGRVAEAMVRTSRELLQYFEKTYLMRRSPATVRRLLHKNRVMRIEAQIRKIGDKPFQIRKLRWLPFSKDVVWEFGWYQGNGTVLLTSYDERVWPRKQKHLCGSEMPFDRIKTVPGKKTAEDFIEVSGWGTHPKGKGIKFIAVGNGPSDILPALEISEEWYGIYIPHGSTSVLFQQEHSDNPFVPPPLTHPRVITLEHIRQMRCIDFNNFEVRHHLDAPCERCALPSSG